MKKKTKKQPSTEEISQKIAGKIVEGLKDIIQAKKESKKDKERKKDVIPKVKVSEGKIKLYTLSDGKEVHMPVNEAKIVGEWFKCLLKRDYAGMKQYFQKLEPLVEGTATEGGNLVPTVLYNKLIPLLEDKAVIKPRATVIDMSGMKTNQLNISSITSKPVAQWGSENAAKATSSMTFGQISLTPYLLACIVPISAQLRDDSPFNVVKIVTQALAEAYSKAEEKAFATGSGSGQPTGIDTYTAGRTVNAGGALSFDHINSAYWRMPQAYRNKAVWLMNGYTIEIVAQLKDSQNRPLLLDTGILTNPGIPALKGRPVLEQNDLPHTSIYFIDLSQYWIGEKLPMTIDIADQATVGGVSLWERNLIAIRLEGRVDGELTTTRAFVEITGI